jgi:hypothetical protein
MAVAERTGEPQAEAPEESHSHLPPLLSSRPLPVQIVLAGMVPALYGALCGWVLGLSEVAYIILAVPLAMTGQVGAGFEHLGGRSGALRGLVAGALFGGAILAVHELTGKEAKAELPHPEIVLLAVTSLFGSGLGAIGGNWRRDAEERGRFLDFKAVSPAELVGMASGLVLFGSLFLTWFSTSDTNRFSQINGARGDLTAWEVFSALDPLLVAACSAPFILTWIIARGHDLTWKPGEVTMIVGITALILILCNGLILGKPGDPDTTISFGIGYLVGILGTVGMLVAGYLRQAVYTSARKPPGVL